jgi:hypothetical protein
MDYNNLEIPLFPSVHGRYIDSNLYRRRPWQSAMKHLGLDPSVYTPYSTRDTFITLALA